MQSILITEDYINNYTGRKTVYLVNLSASCRIITFSICLRLKAAGIGKLEITMGSTPSCSQPGDMVKLLTEIHPGNFAFYGTCSYL